MTAGNAYHGREEMYAGVLRGTDAVQRSEQLLRELRRRGCRLRDVGKRDHPKGAGPAEGLQMPDAAILLLILTQGALQEESFRRGVYEAVNRRIRILSVYLEPCELSAGMHMQLDSYQAVMAYQKSIAETADILCRAMPQEVFTGRYEKGGASGGKGRRARRWLFIPAACILPAVFLLFLSLYRNSPVSENMKETTGISDTAEAEESGDSGSMEAEDRGDSGTTEEVQPSDSAVPEEIASLDEEIRNQYAEVMEPYVSLLHGLVASRVEDRALPDGVNILAEYEQFSELLFSFSDLDGNGSPELMILAHLPDDTVAVAEFFADREGRVVSMSDSYRALGLGQVTEYETRFYSGGYMITERLPGSINQLLLPALFLYRNGYIQQQDLNDYSLTEAAPQTEQEIRECIRDSDELVFTAYPLDMDAVETVRSGTGSFQDAGIYHQYDAK